jgi:MtN3 and saliva related transmembrane protein
VVFVIGVGLWLAYGVALGSLPVILANSLTLLLAAFVLIMKLRHG